jgi:uncharacterized membrane protein
MNTAERQAGTILIVGSYDRDSGAAEALAGIQSLVDNESAQVHGATVVRRHHDGKISVDGGPEESGKAPVGWGALAGVTVGILFPPSLLAGALVGGGVGLGVRSKRNRRTKQLSDAIQNTLPPGSYGVIAIAPTDQIDALDRVLRDSGRVTKSEVDDSLVAELHAHAGQPGAGA